MSEYEHDEEGQQEIEEIEELNTLTPKQAEALAEVDEAIMDTLLELEQIFMEFEHYPDTDERALVIHMVRQAYLQGHQEGVEEAVRRMRESTIQEILGLTGLE